MYFIAYPLLEAKLAVVITFAMSKERAMSNWTYCDSSRQLEGYGLATAHILYGLPDHPQILQSYIWQCYDMAPLFPELEKFLAFWRRELEGPIRSVEIAYKRLVGPNEWRSVRGLYRLN